MEFDVDQLIKEAMKSGQQSQLMLLRNVKSKILLVKTSGGRDPKAPLSTEELHQCLRKELKELNEHLESAKKMITTLAESATGDYQKQVQEDESAIAYLSQFLPQNLSDQETQTLIADLLAQGKKTPEIMKHFSMNFKGRVDMKRISEWLQGK